MNCVGYKQHKFIFHTQEAEKFEIKRSTDLVSGKGPLCPYVMERVRKTIFWGLTYKGTNPIHEDLELANQFPNV
jgi:hypothetical protein